MNYIDKLYNTVYPDDPIKKQFNKKISQINNKYNPRIKVLDDILIDISAKIDNEEILDISEPKESLLDRIIKIIKLKIAKNNKKEKPNSEKPNDEKQSLHDVNKIDVNKINELRNRQERLHKIANDHRKIGHTDNSREIKLLQMEWWRIEKTNS